MINTRFGSFRGVKMLKLNRRIEGLIKKIEAYARQNNQKVVKVTKKDFEVLKTAVYPKYREKCQYSIDHNGITIVPWV